MSIISKIMWLFAPIIQWIDKTFTLKSSIKIVDGDYYYMYRDRIEKGDVFLTSANGHGSNLINPSDVNHGAIYFGKGLRTAILLVVDRLHEMNNVIYNQSNPIYADKIKRLNTILNNYNVSDEICYVIEAVAEGTIPTNLVKFMTTKDRLICLKPVFADDKQKVAASNLSIEDLGKPYDYGFSEDSYNRYCFEVPAMSYESIVPNLALKRHDFKILWKVVHQAFLADTYLEDKNNWRIAFDINEPFKS